MKGTPVFKSGGWCFFFELLPHLLHSIQHVITGNALFKGWRINPPDSVPEHGAALGRRYSAKKNAVPKTLLGTAEFS